MSATDRGPALRFGQGNAKLHPCVTTFSLPAGHTCPGARDCLARADPRTGLIRDGRAARYRCYAASTESLRPSVRRARWANLRLLRGCVSVAAMADLILRSLTELAGYVRIHVAGDFYSQEYFDGWVAVARARPRTVFYAYTKALPFWARRLDLVGDGRSPGAVPNLVLTASLGGRYDGLAHEHGLRSARVVFSQQEADTLGLEVDHDDSCAMRHGPRDFALLVHGVQSAGTEAAKAVRALRGQGFAGYGRTRVPLAVVPSSSGRA